MKNRVAAVSSLVALSLVGPVVAQVPHVVDGPDLFAIGTVISVGNTSMAIRSQDHGHSISFVISTTTLLPTSLAVGSRVRVAYHAVGTTGQVADKVMLLEGPPTAAAAPRASQPQSPSTAHQPGTPATQLPATASPLPLVGFVGLMAFLASLSLKALERARF